MPLYRRNPKRGFTCRNSMEIVGINVSALEVFDNDAVVSVETLIEAGIVKHARDGVKILKLSLCFDPSAGLKLDKSIVTPPI